MNNSNFIIVSFIFILLATSCNHNTKFDSERWKQKSVDWQMSDVRENMVDDLIESDTLLGMNRDEVIDLLGKSEYPDDKGLTYLIREKYGSDIDPEYISYLTVEFDSSGKVRNYIIEK